MEKLKLPLFIIFLFLLAGVIAVSKKANDYIPTFRSPQELAQRYILHSYPPIPNASSSALINPTASPTPRPLTFAEMNSSYGPCVHLPTIFYHHIQDYQSAKEKGQQNLTVDTNSFRSQMQYLKDHGYQTATMADLLNFFSGGGTIPPKSVLLTFDDGYDDFFTNAFPILSQFGFKATMFTPTGLIGNHGYLSWDQISSMNGNILFANHTWSHKSMSTDGNIDEKEISTADTQLSQKGLDVPKVFAYPYGTVSQQAESILTKYGYNLAFTTVPGSALCSKQRLYLPRIRIGNGSLGAYGF